MRLVIISACSNEEIVAKVNGEPISKNELYELLVSQNGGQALEDLITQKLIDQEAQKQNIEVSEEEIDIQLTDLKEAYGGGI